MRPVPSPRSVVCLSAVLLLLSLLGCRAAPTPTATPAPTPTPTPVDVAALFTAFAADEDVAGHGTVSATMSMGEVEVLMSGVVEFDGEDWSTETTVTSDGETTSVRQAQVKNILYESTDHGPWVRHGKPTEAEEQGALAIVRAIEKVKVVDEVDWTDIPGLTPAQRGTGAIYHLRSEQPVDLSPSMVGIDEVTAAYMKDLEVEMDFYVRPDGYPVCQLEEATWASVLEGGPPGKLIVATVFDAYEPVSIVQPKDVWGRFVSEHHRYAVGVPPGYRGDAGETTDEPDVLLSPTGATGLIWVFRDFDEPVDGTEFSAAISQIFGAGLQATAEDGGAVAVGGREMRILVFETTDENGDTLTVLVGAIPHPDGLGGYAVSHPYTGSLEGAKRSFTNILKTFEFLPPLPEQEQPTTTTS